MPAYRGSSATPSSNEADPEALAEHIRGYADGGAHIVGGCCEAHRRHVGHDAVLCAAKSIER